MQSTHFECAVIGEWHLAFTTATSLASLGRKVVLVGSAPLAAGRSFPELPVREPGMAEAIAKAQARRLLEYREGLGSSASGSAKWSADFVWLAIDTPVDEQDRPDVSPLEAAAEQVSRFKLGPSEDGAFVISSQIPLGFSRRLAARFGLRIAYVPENLRLGKGLETFLKADRTVIGADSAETGEKTHGLLKGVETDFFFCDLTTAEMVKHATNAFLATSISFANELARIGETMGVDSMKVAQALKLDKRIGKQAYVAPGLGFAGGTLPRDLRVLQSLAQQGHVPSPLVNAVLEVNQSTADAIFDSAKLYFGGELRGRTALILGYTYKAETDTLRRSPALELSQLLKKAGMKTLGFDPMMNRRDLSGLQGWIEHRDTFAAVGTEADVVFVMTSRNEFLDLDWRQIAQPGRAGTPQLVLDTRSYLPADRVLGAGFAYKALWQPVRRPQ